MTADLTTFFQPCSIAVVGASKNPTKIGHASLKNILISDYRCRLYPVNPGEDEILGMRCYKSVVDLPESPDLVLISVPAPTVPSVLKDCVAKKVKWVIIISSGFSEIGNHEAEAELCRIVKGSGVRILGPNTMGYKNASAGIDVSFVFGMPRKGNLGLISQSGALGMGMIYLANNEFVGLSKIVGVGNKLDIDDDDLITYMANDPETSVVGLYIEGIRHGRDFMNAIKACDKPVLVVKAGRSKAGARATASHTGSMAGSDAIYSAAITQAGGIRCRDLVELFDMARALAGQPPAQGNRIGIVTTYEKMQKILPPLIKPNNPVDLVADAGFYRYWASTLALLQDPNIDGIIVASVHAGYARPREYTGAIQKMIAQQRLHHEYQKPILGCWVGGREFEELVQDLKAVGVPIYPSSWRAARSMYALFKEGQRLKREAKQRKLAR